jgi:hypothetical protein
MVIFNSHWRMRITWRYTLAYFLTLLRMNSSVTVAYYSRKLQVSRIEYERNFHFCPVYLCVMETPLSCKTIPERDRISSILLNRTREFSTSNSYAHHRSWFWTDTLKAPTPQFHWRYAFNPISVSKVTLFRQIFFPPRRKSLYFLYSFPP